MILRIFFLKCNYINYTTLALYKSIFNIFVMIDFISKRWKIWSDKLC